MSSGFILAVVFASAAHAQPSPAIYTWSWDPADTLLRMEAQVFVDEPSCTNICFENTVGALNWPFCPTTGMGVPPPTPWPWSILPPVPPPAPPPPPMAPPIDWDESPLPPPAELGTIFVGDYCPSPTTDNQGNFAAPPPPLDPMAMLPMCDVSWASRVGFQPSLTFVDMLGHPDLLPEKLATNGVFATDGDVPWATIPCFNAPGNGAEVSADAVQVLSVRGVPGLIGQVNNQGVRTWEMRWTNEVENFAFFPLGADRFVSEGAATMVAQVPLEIDGLTPGVPVRFTFEFQTLGEADSTKEVHPYLDPFLNARTRPDVDNAYALATLNLYVDGLWSTQFIEYVGDAPGVPPISSPHGGQGGATFVVTPTASTLPVVLRATTRSRTYIEDAAPAGHYDPARASMKANIWLTVFGPPLTPGLAQVPAGGPGPAYDFWIGRNEISNIEFVDFLNDAEEDANNPAGGSERSDFMVFGADGRVTTSGALGLRLFEPEPQAPSPAQFQKIRYRPSLQPGTRYVADTDSEGDPVTGVTWYGALKYCNWLTLQAGYPPSERCYTEGLNAADWHPVTAASGQFDLTPAERADLVANYKGFRLPMDNLAAASGHVSDQPNAYNEWYKALAYDPAAPNFSRIGPGGETVPALHWTYAFGRDSISGADANYLASGDPRDDDTLPTGFFNGTTFLADGTSTHDTDNVWGLFDGSGNVDEWGQDHGPLVFGQPMTPTRAVRTGSWNNSAARTAASYRGAIPPEGSSGLAATSTRDIGFRVLSTSPWPTGACCHPNGCDVMTSLACSVIAGSAFRGDGTDCADLNQNGAADVCECLTCRGDMNGDSKIDATDIRGFVGCILGAGWNCGCADMNADGSLDSQADAALFVAALLGQVQCP